MATKYTADDAAKDAKAPRKEVDLAWHTARDDAGRGDYNDKLRDPVYKDKAAKDLGDTLAGKIMDLPSGYKSSEDK